VGSGFFAGLDGSKKVFKEADQALLVKVFYPALSDRRSEGSLFVPPDASHSYVEHLRSLVKEEDMIREWREEAFFGEDFMMDSPGTLFPHSWTPSFEVARGPESMPEGRAQGSLVPRPEYMNQAMLLEQLKTSAPVFDKSAEDGRRFRVYRIGSLEIRTTQEHERDEVVGAVFSVQLPKATTSTPDVIDEREQLTKILEYVEHAGAKTKGVSRRYYLLLETEKGNKIVTERLSNGRSSWVFNPADLDDRCSLAKLTRSETCTSSVSIRDMMNCRAKLADGNAALSSKRFVQAMLLRAVGSARGVWPSNREFSTGLKA
jgi:hypothetical protein